MYVAQQFVMDHRIAGSVFRAYRFQARYSEQRLENILETRNAALEIIYDTRGIPALVLHALKHPSLDLFFSGNGGKVGQGKVVIAIEMHAFRHELLATLIVDDLCNRVWELLIFRIAGSRGANAVTLHHPATAKSEQCSQAPAERRHLSVCRRTEIGSLKLPSRKPPAVLQQENPVLNQGVVEEQVG